MMIVAIDPLMGVLKHGSPDEIVVALHNLAQLGKRCGESAYVAIVDCSKNKNTAIKVAALQALDSWETGAVMMLMLQSSCA